MQSIINFFIAILTIKGGIDWTVVRQFLFNEIILKGIVITIVLSVISQAIGTIIGLVLYLMRQSKNVALRGISDVYVWIFRGTPLLLQLLLLYSAFPLLNLTNFLRTIDFSKSIGFPQVPLESFLIGVIAFSLNEGAYMAEIVRSGIDSIDVGQMEAAKSLGMNYGLAMRRIILPQAARVIIPPLGNEFNNMLKTTSLATVISLYELLNSVRQIGSQTFQPLSLLIVASIWYLGMTTVWGLVQNQLERRFNPTATPTASGPSLINRLVGVFGSRASGVASASNLGR